MIVFKSVRYQNFLSTGKKMLEIDLTKTSTTVIVGDNGTGKSSGIIDAVFYALYGKAYRKINLPQIINSINNKNLLVELDFEIDGKEYTIRRGLKPKVFDVFVDGELKEQDASTGDYQNWLENTVLKMNATTMKQIVFLGSTSYTPFMRLTAAERRKVVEEILDIQIFSIMNKILKQRASSLGNLYENIKNDLRLMANTIDLKMRHRNELDQQKESAIEENTQEIELLTKNVALISEEITQFEGECDEIIKEIVDQAKTEKNHRELSTIIARIESSKRAHEDDLQFFESNDECPTCRQEIADDHKSQIIEKNQKAVDQCVSNIQQACQKLEEFEARLSEIKQLQSALQRKENSLGASRVRVSEIERRIASLVEKNKQLANKSEDDSISTLDAEIKQLEFESFEKRKERDELAGEAQYLSVISGMLKDDGIKSQIVRNYLPTINSLIRKYLEILEFPCEFTFDENFNETMKSRFRDTFSYANFSEGQKMRIDLALLFTWRELARLRNSASTNLLVLDEIGSSSLDSAGTEAFMRIIEETAVGSNVFVITHDDTVTDKFERTIHYSLKDNFSHMVEQ